MPNGEENKRIVRRYVNEVWNNNDLAAADEILDDSFRIKGTGYRPDKDGEKEFVQQHRQAFPDMRYSITRMIAEGDEVSASIVGRGTHRGPWMGRPATGRRVTIRGDATFTIRNGKIVESVHHVDLLGLRIDIGAINEDEVFPAPFRRPSE
jgi:steroid delta-isomerase-like uncharacterized protein